MRESLYFSVSPSNSLKLLETTLLLHNYRGAFHTGNFPYTAEITGLDFTNSGNVKHWKITSFKRNITQQNAYITLAWGDGKLYIYLLC